MGGGGEQTQAHLSTGHLDNFREQPKHSENAAVL